jgi:hypothetical protein
LPANHHLILGPTHPRLLFYHGYYLLHPFKLSHTSNQSYSVH